MPGGSSAVVVYSSLLPLETTFPRPRVRFGRVVHRKANDGREAGRPEAATRASRIATTDRRRHLPPRLGVLSCRHRKRRSFALPPSAAPFGSRSARAREAKRSIPSVEPVFGREPCLQGRAGAAIRKGRDTRRKEAAVGGEKSFFFFRPSFPDLFSPRYLPPSSSSLQRSLTPRPSLSPSDSPQPRTTTTRSAPASTDSCPTAASPPLR